MRFKSNNFCLKVRFSQAQHAISDFFQRPVFFICDFFDFFFIEVPPQFLPKMKRFATLKDSSRFSALCDFKKIAGDLQKNFGNFLKKIQKNFSFNFLFVFKVFRWGRWVFLLFSVGEEWFSRLMPIPSGIFWRCKIDEMLTYSFYPWFYVWYCLFGFQNFASVCEARLRLCVWW